MNSAAAAAMIPTTVPICLILVFILISAFQLFSFSAFGIKEGKPTASPQKGHLSQGKLGRPARQSYRLPGLRALRSSPHHFRSGLDAADSRLKSYQALKGYGGSLLFLCSPAPLLLPAQPRINTIFPAREISKNSCK
jgi:hypothetical protein